jgi:hypothetical protein
MTSGPTTMTMSLVIGSPFTMNQIIKMDSCGIAATPQAMLKVV